MNLEHASNSGDPGNSWLLGIAGLPIPLVVAAFNALALYQQYEFDYEGWSGPLVLTLVVLATCACIPIGGMWALKRPDSRFARIFGGRILVIAGIAAALFWMGVAVMVLTGNLYYDMATPMELVGASLAIFGGIVLGGLVLTAILSMVREK